jgi:hypothetical protein
MSEHKPNAALVKTPVDSIPGDPGKREPSLGSDDSVYGMKGPEGVSAGLGTNPVLVYNDIAPNTKGDSPSDRKQFQGVSEV